MRGIGKVSMRLGGEKMNREKTTKNIEILLFYNIKEHTPPKKLKFLYKKQNSVLPIVILEFEYPSS